MNKQEKLQELITKSLLQYCEAQENARKGDEEFEDILSRKYVEGFLDGLLISKNIFKVNKRGSN